ncbi:unnamed protein product [Closterium sp. NIES-53]
MTLNILLLPFLSLLFLHSRPYHTSYQIPRTAPIATVAFLAVVTTLPDLPLPVAAGSGRGGKGPGGPKQGGRKGGGGWGKGKGRGGMGPDGGPLPDGSGDDQVPPQEDSTPPPVVSPPSTTTPPSDGGETASGASSSSAESSDMLGPEEGFVADGSTAAPGSEVAPGGGGDGSPSHLDSKQGTRRSLPSRCRLAAVALPQFPSPPHSPYFPSPLSAYPEAPPKSPFPSSFSPFPASACPAPSPFVSPSLFVEPAHLLIPHPLPFLLPHSASPFSARLPARAPDSQGAGGTARPLGADVEPISAMLGDRRTFVQQRWHRSVTGSVVCGAERRHSQCPLPPHHASVPVRSSMPPHLRAPALTYAHLLVSLQSPIPRSALPFPSPAPACQLLTSPMLPHSSPSSVSSPPLSHPAHGGTPALPCPALPCPTRSLADNSLTGKLPKSVSDLTRLETLCVRCLSFSLPFPSLPVPPSLLSPSFLTLSLLHLPSFHPSFHVSVPSIASSLPSPPPLPRPLPLISLPSAPSPPTPRAAMQGAVQQPALGRAQNYFTGEATVTVAGTPFCPSTQPQSLDLILSTAAAEALSGGPSISSSSSSQSTDLSGLTDTGSGGYPSLLLNCLTFPEGSACAKAGVVEQQRTALACAGFCGASLEAGPCGGHGMCVLGKGSGEATCVCDSGFMPGLENATVEGVVVTYPTCSKNPENAIPPPDKPATGSFSMGFQPSIPGGRFFNPYFRYASVGFKGTPADPSWTYKDSVDWREPSDASAGSSSDSSSSGFVGYIRDQGHCAACWAFAAVDTVASAYAIANHLPSVPPLSTQQVLDCAKGDCSSGGFPGDAFRMLASPPLVSSNALCSEDMYPFDGESDSSNQCKGVKGQYRIPLVYEQISFYGWLGIALAVQQHPVVVSVAADSDSFKKFTGGYVYNDPACFASGLVSHNLVVVGYNVLAPEPYWILRNSWGTDWGEDGYMRMAITARADPTGAIEVNGGAGVCGIYATPALYPVVAVRVCALYQTNPCWVGTCVDNNEGSFSCLCPPGFMQGIKADGTTTCVPVISQEDKGTYLITGPGVTCYALAISYGFTQAELEDKNPDLDCSADILPSTLLDISDSSLAPCSLPYTVTPIDTCDSIAETFNISAADLTSLNPALNCSRLVIGIQICVARGQAYQFPLCTRYHDVADGETCTSLMQVQARPPLSPFDFFAMNPGLMCNNLVPTKPGDGLGGQQVCLASLPFSAFKCVYQTYYTKRGDTCASIYMKYFRTPAAKAKTTPARLGGGGGGGGGGSGGGGCGGRDGGNSGGGMISLGVAEAVWLVPFVLLGAAM